MESRNNRFSSSRRVISRDLKPVVESEPLVELKRKTGGGRDTID